MSRSTQTAVKRRGRARADARMAELAPAEQLIVAGGNRIEGPIVQEVQATLSAGTTGGSASKVPDDASLLTFTTLATTPSCAIILGVTFAKSCVGCS